MFTTLVNSRHLWHVATAGWRLGEVSIRQRATYSGHLSCPKAKRGEIENVRAAGDGRPRWSSEDCRREGKYPVNAGTECERRKSAWKICSGVGHGAQYVGVWDVLLVLRCLPRVGVWSKD